MMVIENKYNLGDIVYLKTDPDQLRRIVTAIVVGPNGLLYDLSIGGGGSQHYDIEISVEKDILFTISN
jgi:hypothetical protein